MPVRPPRKRGSGSFHEGGEAFLASALVISVSISPEELVLIQVSSDRWTWPERTRDATLTIGGGWSFALKDAFYSGRTIEHTQQGVESLRFFSGAAEGAIEMLDHRGQVLARVPSDGFARMLDAAIRCAARQ